MRQDIVELLKTSKMDLVRALIGLPSLASSKWRCLKLMVLAVHAFQQHGQELAKRKMGKELFVSVIVLDILFVVSCTAKEAKSDKVCSL